MSSDKDKIRAFLGLHREDQARMLAELVRTPSDNPPGDCAPHAVRAAVLLESLGLQVERHPVPDDEVRACGMISATNLVVRHRFGEGPVIACNAHGDVVPPGMGWSHDPYGAEIVDGEMFGRGVATSKCDFVTYAYALFALIHSQLALSGTVELHFTYDEEAGGLIGPGRLLKQGRTKPDYAISAGFSYAVTIAHNGCLHLEIDVQGQSAHAARPDTGLDALEAANAVLSHLYALRKRYAVTRSGVPGIESPTLVVGLIQGGINTNVVPDRVTLRLDRRIVPEESPAQVERELVDEIEAVARDWPGIRCTVRRILLAEPFVPLPGHEHLADALIRNARVVLGEEIRTQGVPLYTDARLYSAAGVPTVLYGAGPRTMLEANAHRADEKLLLTDLHAATEIVAGALMDLLQPPGSSAVEAMSGDA